MSHQIGLGVMIGMLSGNSESVKAFTPALNKKITSLSLSDNSLHFVFEDGYKIKLFDDGQSCCERRYMTTDDDLGAFVGSTLTGAEVRDGNRSEPDQKYDDAHDREFLLIQTSEGVFTMTNHNEHNGYYGGFNVKCEEE